MSSSNLYAPALLAEAVGETAAHWERELTGAVGGTWDPAGYRYRPAPGASVRRVPYRLWNLEEMREVLATAQLTPDDSDRRAFVLEAPNPWPESGNYRAAPALGVGVPVTINGVRMLRETRTKVELRRGPYARHVPCTDCGLVAGKDLAKVVATWPVPTCMADLLAWAAQGVSNILAVEEFARAVAPQFKTISWEAVDAKQFWADMEPPGKDDIWRSRNSVVAWADPDVAALVLQCEPAADIEANRHRIHKKYLPWIEPLRDLNARGVMFRWSRWGRPILRFPR